MTNGSHFSAQDVLEAISFKAEAKTVQVSDVRKGAQAKLRSRARHRLPEIHEIGTNLRADRRETGAKLHIPFLGQPSETHDMGGSEWCDPFANGLPVLGELAAPGAQPLSSQKIPEPISREKLLQSAAP